MKNNHIFQDKRKCSQKTHCFQRCNSFASGFIEAQDSDLGFRVQSAAGTRVVWSLQTPLHLGENESDEVKLHPSIFIKGVVTWRGQLAQLVECGAN